MTSNSTQKTNDRYAQTLISAPPKQGLYDPQFEHDACGLGFVVNIKGRKSHQLVSDALQILVNLDHRGAVGCEPNTGDGAGILIQVPHDFFVTEATKLGFKLPAFGQYGVGQLFLPKNSGERDAVKKELAKIISDEGQTVLGWRDVPVDNSSLGKTAVAAEPFMEQVFVGRNSAIKDDAAFERKLYVIRKVAEQKIRYAGKIAGGKTFYVSSLSARTLTYKGMLMSEQVGKYFNDLRNPAVTSALALVHSRFSTNTFPSWDRAHPNRCIAHNGEINTLRGNVNWMKARQMLFQSKLFGDDIKKIIPVINTDGSDSAQFDNCVELLVMAGRELPHAMMMMIPEPWENHESMDAERRAFYEFHSCLIEPWDGPASMAFTDGKMIGACLDRNGLRPSRYYVTKDDLVIMASEAGVLPVAPERIAIKGRLQPGRMFLVDIEQGRIVADEELKKKYSSAQPYKKWLEENHILLENLPEPSEATAPDHRKVLQRQQAFGYTFEDLRFIVGPMGADGVQPLGSMGTDTPLAVLSNKSQLLYNYFKQLFAQVTNPPIDPIREEIVTSTEIMLGGEGNILEPTAESSRMIKLKHPILANEELEKLRQVNRPGFKAVTLPILFEGSAPASGAAERAPRSEEVSREGAENDTRGACAPAKNFEAALAKLFSEADKAIADGVNILVLSDRGISKELAPIPALLAVAGLHHHLIRSGTRTKVGIVLESGEPREVHHFALLIGYGCTAINPYLAFATLDDLIQQGLLTKTDHKTAIKKYIKAAIKGVVKTMAKMGISTIQSYHGAQIFEAIGLNSEVVEKYFTWTPSRIQGVGLDVIAEEALTRHRHAFPDRAVNGVLDAGGQYQWRDNGEFHLFNPQTIHKLQNACRTGNYKIFQEYAALINNQAKNLCTLRGLLDFKFAENPIPIEEVESVDEIVKRFKTGAMSYGSISKEAHEALAVAMNRIGGRSNTGEGGEDPARYFSNKGSSPFLRGKLYSRPAIKDILGGGSEIEFLPEINGRIVAACLRLDLNPNAPDVILPGFGEARERTAKLLCEQQSVIPVFIRRATNEWEYVGDYEIRDFSTDSKVIAEHEALSGRSGEEGISRVIYMQSRNYNDSKNSAIKQVASGRFGVTSHYLVNAKELQIKMAQGAKPGEGGELPGKKVYPPIAKVRGTTAGVGLISPPPHHDIYSIEDLAELIHDLKNSNRNARVSVKLVAEVGVGTIAAGVSKAHADVVLISGHDGGTGASPLSSIKHAGGPWELGLAEAHQTLVLNNLRSRIYVEADGQLKTGRDVAIAALLGAEEFGFATAPLVSLGCIMMRVCHLNTCPVGVATQDPRLRARFAGGADNVVNFMKFVAQELREIMAKLGFRKLEDMVGRTDKLFPWKAIEHWKAKGLDLTPILHQPEMGADVGRFRSQDQDHGLEKSLDVTKILDICKPAIERGEKVRAELSIINVNRVVGTITGSEITKKHGPNGLPEDTVQLKFNGSAGQSFGAFIPRGMTLELEGDANDYLGKGLSGGKIIVYPPKNSTFVAEDNIIIGNVALYGATAGEIFVRGMAGERFGVRNSGVNAVVEAVGDHGCEYMTGGRVVILGKTGRNFAAGMSGGVAYVLDEAGDFATRCNMELVGLEKPDDEDFATLKSAIEEHAINTKSTRAAKILAEWSSFAPKFVKVMPQDYKRVLQSLKKVQSQGLSGEDAIMAAFEENVKGGH